MSVMRLTATSSLVGIGVGWTVERLDHMHQLSEAPLMASFSHLVVNEVFAVPCTKLTSG
jgi:hypothetical protein